MRTNAQAFHAVEGQLQLVPENTFGPVFGVFFSPTHGAKQAGNSRSVRYHHRVARAVLYLGRIKRRRAAAGRKINEVEL